YISVSDLERERLAKHPWSLGGGGAGDLKAAIDQSAKTHLVGMSSLIGYTGQTNADEVMLAPATAFRRRSVESNATTLMAVGDLLRDWCFSEGDSTVFP